MAKEKAADRAGEKDANPALPEDGGAAAAVGAELPFSDMIARWLDDGDKLHERVHEPNELTAEVAGHEGRVRAFVENARAHAQRHRRVIGGAALLLVIVSVVAFRRAHLGAGSGEMVSVESTAPGATLVEPAIATVVPSNTIAVVPPLPPPAPAVASAPAPAAAPSPPPAATPETPPAAPETPLAAPEPTGAAVSPQPLHGSETTALAVADQHPAPAKLETKPELKAEGEMPKHTASVTALAATAPPVAGQVRKPRTTEAPASAAAPPLEACKSALIRQRSRDALAACSQVFGGDPRSSDNMVLLARADLLAGRTGETLTLARRAVAANPRQADAYLLIGTIQQTSGQRTEARIAYETYLQLSPYGAHASDVKAILKTL